jgi:hypothetical protein
MKKEILLSAMRFLTIAENYFLIVKKPEKLKAMEQPN